MAAQARSTDDHRYYAPSRDIAHNFLPVVMAVGELLEQERVPSVEWMVAEGHATEEEVGRAAQAFIHFIRSSLDNPEESYEDCLERSGFLDVPEPARQIYLAALGTVMSGWFFRGVREATLGGSGPLDDYPGAKEIAERTLRVLHTPWYRRVLWRIRGRIRRRRQRKAEANGGGAEQPGVSGG